MSHTSLPNRCPNPTLMDVRLCSPIFSARERLCALILDVAKAHRHIRIRLCDRGLRGKLYLSSCLNFGARAPAVFLALLESTSAPFWSGMLVVLLLILRVPMSWHSAQLSPRVVWIGWSFDFSLQLVSLESGKQECILQLIRFLLKCRSCSWTFPGTPTHPDPPLCGPGPSSSGYVVL